MSQNQGKIHIYTGEGKGKTTASLGLAIRAIGQGMKVGIIYFDKGGDYYNERKILNQLENQGLKYMAFGLPRMIGDKFRFDNLPEDISQAKQALSQAKKWMSDNLDMLILDEINTTVKTELLDEANILDVINEKPTNLELVLTGRYCPDKVMEQADLITEMQAIKHYSDDGLSARPGIEF